MLKRPLLKLLTLFTLSLLFVGCGKGGNSGTTTTSGTNAIGTAAGTCQIGWVWTSSQGCLVSYGVYGEGYGNNGQPVPGSCWNGTVMTQYGCQASGNSNFGSTNFGSTNSSGGWTCQPQASGYTLCCNGSYCTYN